MLLHAITNVMMEAHREKMIARIQLQMIYFAVQNKNWFLLIYLWYRTVTELNDKIYLVFMVFDYTKNVSDLSSGQVKRLLKTTDTRTPREMMNVVENCSIFNCFVPWVFGTWWIWNPFVENTSEYQGSWQSPSAISLDLILRTLRHLFKEYPFFSEGKWVDVILRDGSVARIREGANHIFTDDTY